MCDERSGSVSNQRDTVCDDRDCELRKKGGVWICCMCEYGDKGPDRNRYQFCTSCNHEICGDCKKWTKDAAPETEGDNESDVDENDDESDGDEQSNGDEETTADDASEEFNAEQEDDDTYGRTSNNTSASGSVYSPDSSDYADDSD